MSGNEYQELAMRTNDGKCGFRLYRDVMHYSNPTLGIDFGALINACIGLSGEVGELNDIIKKWVFHEKELDEEHLKRELGDVMWYAALFCDSMGWSLDEIMELNIDKLKERYPNGFDTRLSNHRGEGDV